MKTLFYSLLGLVLGAAAILLPSMAFFSLSERAFLRPKVEGQHRKHTLTSHLSLMKRVEIKEIEMQWPSQTAVPSVDHDLAWPSSTWNDTHFGQFAARAAENAQQNADRRAVEKDTSKKSRISRKGTEKVPNARAVDWVGLAGDDLAVGSPPANGPSVAEIERLVKSQGIAGAVESLMKTYGWDFRRAARELAKARGG